MSEMITLMEAAEVLEPCAHEYLQRHRAFARLQDAAIFMLHTGTAHDCTTARPSTTKLGGVAWTHQ